MVKLQIFITSNCWSCRESEKIAAEAAIKFPELAVELLDLEKVDRPENIFAVPTYVLNGDVIFLGNPTREELSEKLNNGKSQKGQTI